MAKSDALGLLVVNLGSPEAPTRSAVSAYLKEFLMDPFVIDIPKVPRFMLVHGIIAPFRAGSSSKLYQNIWTEKGSPLVCITRYFAEAVKARMAPRWQVRWAMRYGSPSIRSVIAGWNVDKIVVVPLYPQYAESSSRTAIDKVKEELRQAGWSGRLEVLQDFFTEAEFIETLADRINNEIDAFKPDHILLSYHGLPERHVKKLHPDHCLQKPGCCDEVTASNRMCYRAQSFATSRALLKKLNFASDRISTGFQSRLGRDPWIKPYTDEVVTELAKKGVRRILVSCPSFVADCLETLEEIQLRLREQFLEEGGEDLRLVPALNAEPQWIEKFSQMVERKFSAISHV